MRLPQKAVICGLEIFQVFLALLIVPIAKPAQEIRNPPKREKINEKFMFATRVIAFVADESRTNVMSFN